MSELPKTYDPKAVEDKLYSFWNDSGFFHAEVNPKKKPYTIVIPPPNVTGQLHMGHAFDETLQDILIRTKRMQGYAALWMPGTDHAGIATQIKVEENLRKEEGKTRYDLGREEFLKRVWDWKHKLRQPHHQPAEKARLAPATGSASASRWTRAAPRRSAKFS